MRMCWDVARSKTIAAISSELMAQAKRAADVSIADLVAANPLHSHGVYFFCTTDSWAAKGIAALQRPLRT